jgi:putative SOS response-associated peptidase YedK
MCAIFYDDLKAAEFSDWFRVPELPELETPLLYPGYTARILGQNQEGEWRARTARWGLSPQWVEDPLKTKLTFNARSETIGEKPTFAPAFRKRRCLLIGRAYFEWIGEKGKMQPVRFGRKDGRPLLFAGLWEVWRREGREVVSCTMATTDANSFVANYHDRMPVVLEPDEAVVWVNPGTPEAELRRLLAPADESLLTAEVTTRSALEALR